MGERIPPPSFERRHTQMIDVTRFVMSNHPKEFISNGWTGIQDSSTSFLPLTRSVVENAVATVMAAGTRFELAKEAKKITSSQKIPKNEDNKILAAQLIKDITRQAAAPPNVYEKVPQLNVRRDIAQNLARLEHLCKLDTFINQDLTPEKKDELYASLFRGGITIEEKMEVAARLALIAVTLVDQFVSSIPAQGKPQPIDETIFLHHSRGPHLLFDQFAELELDFPEAS